MLRSKLSVIVPVLNEAPMIVSMLAALSELRCRGAEVIVVDGGSNDGTANLAEASDHADAVLRAGRGRAVQMNAGAARARGDVLLFLHADTRLPEGADLAIGDALAVRNASGGGWGRFDVSIDGHHLLLPVVAFCMNLRSRLTGVATGDQAIFVTRSLFDQVGGFKPEPLMEDIALSNSLRRHSAPLCLRARVSTSGRRWDQNGVLRTILLMWRLRLAYFVGVSPQRLARLYEGGGQRGG